MRMGRNSCEPSRSSRMATVFEPFAVAFLSSAMDFTAGWADVTLNDNGAVDFWFPTVP